MIRLPLLLLLMFFARLACAQFEVSRVPVQFGQFNNNLYSLNPASMGVFADVEANAGVQFSTGPWSNIYTYYANAYFQLSPQRKAANGTNHMLGFNLENDREGEFINRFRGHALYAVHVSIARDVSLGVGTNVGVVNHNISSTPLSAGGGDVAFDGGIGLWLYGAKYQAGIAMGQLFNSTLTPIEETTKLTRLVNINGDKWWSVHHNVELGAIFWGRWVLGNSELSVFDIGLVANMQEQLLAGATYRHERGYAMLLGIDNIRLYSGALRVTFSYNIAKQNGFSNINTFELTMKYNVKPIQSR